MPANLTPEYFKAEKWYRQAGTADEKILALEQMLRVIPKHKGTDHLRADLRKKLSKLKDSSAVKKSAGGVDIFYVPKSGAGQIVLIGTPNSGKSAIVEAMTNAKVHVADFPFTTNAPVPGMVEFEDIKIELVDMPPITADFSAAGQVGTYRNCDLIGIVIDLSADIDEQCEVVFDYLQTRRLIADETTPAADEAGNVLGKNAVVIAAKSDSAKAGNIKKLKNKIAERFETIVVNVFDESALTVLKKRMFELLHIVRVYTKKPGKPPDMSEPFTLPAGATVMDLAEAVHRQMAEKLKSARAWGAGVHDGQNVHLEHILSDGDIIELHFS